MTNTLDSEVMMRPRVYFASLVAAAFLGGIIALGLSALFSPRSYSNEPISARQARAYQPYTTATQAEMAVPDGINFVNTAEQVREAVVYIKVRYRKVETARNNEDELDNIFRKYHGGHTPMASSGSGVIITDNGYIATNHHVVDKAVDIQVILNDKRSYRAKLIGQDPSTDLALLKIEETDLPFVPFGNSDHTKVGEWVLAVGNPLELNATVTAGIISAKGRNINLLRDVRDGGNYAIESFLQTDAVVNPGNSGGALVNLRGELIGINTAIASQTGYYAGYSFAVPVNIVRKIMEDLQEFGTTRRALLGVQIRDVDAVLAADQGLAEVSGVFVAGLSAGGAAEQGGLRIGDVIQQIDQHPTQTSSELQAVIATHRPGDKISVSLLRKGQQITLQLTLQGDDSRAQTIAKNTDKSGKTGGVATQDRQVLGALLSPLPSSLKQKLKLKTGVQVVAIEEGKLQKAGLRQGFVITHINETRVALPEEVENALKPQKRVTTIEGVYPNGDKAHYAVGW